MKKEVYDNSVKTLLDESKYYDKEQVEIKTILNNINLDNKKIVDIGAGVGRLALPLTKYAKNVIALDSNNKLMNYYKTIKNPKLKFIYNKAEKYLKNKQFDTFIFAWPPLDKKLVRVIKKSMHEKSQLIIFIPNNNSDYESIMEKIGIISNSESKKYSLNKQKFLKFLERDFKVIKKDLLKTKYTYQNKSVAFNKIKENINFWYDVELTTEQLNQLKMIINLHNNHKVLFNELVYFYILEK
jgi:16S rRNA G966 N2-methylase RsmD